MKLEEIKKMDDAELEMMLQVLIKPDIIKVPPPNYCTDLNAIAEVEKIVIEKVNSEYLPSLQEVIRSNPAYRKDWALSIATASARQRAEACLLALQETDVEKT